MSVFISCTAGHLESLWHFAFKPSSIIHFQTPVIVKWLHNRPATVNRQMALRSLAGLSVWKGKWEGRSVSGLEAHNIGLNQGSQWTVYSGCIKWTVNGEVLWVLLPGLAFHLPPWNPSELKIVKWHHFGFCIHEFYFLSKSIQYTSVLTVRDCSINVRA
jgi:hypothetical protein